MRNFFRIMMAICALGFATALTGCQQEEDPASEAAEAMENAAEEAGDAAEEAGDAVEDAMQ